MNIKVFNKAYLKALRLQYSSPPIFVVEGFTHFFGSFIPVPRKQRVLPVGLHICIEKVEENHMAKKMAKMVEIKRVGMVK